MCEVVCDTQGKEGLFRINRKLIISSRKKEKNCSTKASSEEESTTSTASLVTNPVTLPIVLDHIPRPIALTQPAMKASIAVAKWTIGLIGSFGARAFA